LCPIHSKKYISIYYQERKKEGKHNSSEEAQQTHQKEGEASLPGKQPIRSKNMSTSAFSLHASSARDKLIERTVISCSMCRNQLEIENPEIFKIIIQLLASARGHTSDSGTCYIFNKLSFLTSLSPSNQHRVAEAEVVCDLLENFSDILTAPDSALVRNSSLHSTVLRLVSKIASYSISLGALLKYLKLMADPANFPISLLSTLVSIARR